MRTVVLKMMMTPFGYVVGKSIGKYANCQIKLALALVTI